jgi:PAS domain S-box-containing protein/excisionase family DNA binding protein
MRRRRVTVPSDVPGVPVRSGVPTGGSGARAFYNISQAAALLGVSRASIWRWIRAGRLPAARLGHRTVRIARADLARMLVPPAPAASRSRTGAGRGADRGAAAGEAPPATHIVQFYEQDAVLLDAVADAIGAALRGGDAGIVIATPAHRAGIEQRLAARGPDLAAARAAGRYVALDAAQTLAQIMADGAPDRRRFAEVIGGLIRQAASSGRGVCVFGEMVALLVANGQGSAALALEALWNELQTTLAFSLWCAYPMGRLDAAALAELVDDVCAQHTHIIPTESYTTLSTAHDRLRAITVLQQRARRLEAEVAERNRVEERYRDLVHTIDAIVWEADARTFRFTFVSPQAERVLGYPVDRWLSEPHFWADHIHPDDRGWAIAYCLRCTAAGEDHEFEYRCIAADGRVVWLRDIVRVVRDAAGDPALLRGVMVDITATKQAEVELRRREQMETQVALNGALREAAARDVALADAQEALRLRDALVSSISHDLKTPLTTIKGQAQLLLRRAVREGAPNPDWLREGLARIDATATKMASLIGELVDVVQLEAGADLELERAPTDLVALVRGAVDEQRCLSERHRFRLVAPAGDLVGKWDGPRLERVIGNLLANAVKYSPYGGTITVTVAREAEDRTGRSPTFDPASWAVLSVADEGLGIPAADLPYIFEPYRRGHNIAGHIAGTGIGLAGSRHIVELHGGTIAVQSREGQGTTVTVRLPLG